MKWLEYIDAEEVKKAITTLQQPEDVFEIRVIGTTKKDILSGYFRDADTLLAALDTIDLRQRNVYITLGKVKEECFARSQSERFLKNPQTSSDSEIISYRWLFIDFDPVRSAGISSSDQELLVAEAMAEEVRCYLRELNFEEPVYALSGNGYHLLYRIDIPNDEQGRDLVAKCLKALSEIFDTEKVKIDTSNSNPSRICKLHGTLAQKGRSTKDRPHRMSRIMSSPDPVKVCSREALQQLANKVQETAPKPMTTVPRPRKEFDLIDFMSRHGMTYKEGSTGRGRMFMLDECPFDPSHKDGDAKIFLYPDGAIAFKCHHNSCQRYRWQDVREKFEPGVYDREVNQLDDDRYDEGYKQHRIVVAAEKALQKTKQKKQTKIRKLKNAAKLLSENHPEPIVFIGCESEVPLLTEGTCILSAKPKLGKSWFALSMCLALANGDDFLGYKTRKCSTLYLDLETSAALQQKRIRKALKGAKPPSNFYIDGETNKLDDGFVEQIEAYLEEDPHIGVVVVDVFQVIRTGNKSIKETEYEHAYRDITPLNELANKRHIAIILVCHDRKAVDPDDPFSNILGSTGLQGAAAQMIVMYRKSKDRPIHVSVKSKTVDGLPELDLKFENAVWEVVENADDPDAERKRILEQYRSSEIREAVLRVIEGDGRWSGRAGELIIASADMDFGLTYPAKEIGSFLSRNIGNFLAEDGVHVKFVSNGTGGRTYKIWKSSLVTVDTVDEN